MQLDFTPDQDALRDTVRTVLERECPASLVREVVEKATTPTAFWRKTAELDWPALTVPEEHGGIGLGFVELAVLAEELGRVIAPGPLLPTVSQLVPAVREAGTPDQQARVLGAVARGELTGSLAVAEDTGRWDAEAVAATAEPTGAGGGGWVLTGAKRWVIEADHIDELVVAARTPQGLGLFLVPAAELTIAPVVGFDGSRTVATVELDGVTVSAERLLGEPGAHAERALQRSLEEATVALALEMVGTCQAIFDIALAYAKERVQFGVPIGSFQAVKHKFADLMVALERARATAYFAAAAIAEDDDRRALAASMAKAAAGDAQRLCAKEGIQVHGGIGYMWENDVQLFVKRAKAGELLLGGAAHHRARIADLIGL